MRILFIEIIVFSALMIILTSCSSSIDGISFNVKTDLNKDGIEEELGINFKL